MNRESITGKLADRGLSPDQIDKAMKEMVGSDWREVDVDVWFERLKSEGHVLHDDRKLTVDDLEALIKGRITIQGLEKIRRS